MARPGAPLLEPGETMRKLAATTLLAFLACAGDDSEQGSDSPVGHFCEVAAASPGCDPVQPCEDHFEQGRIANPACAAGYTEFAACLAQLEIACQNSSDFAIYATGDGSAFDQFIQVLPIYLFYVRDTECREIGEELEGCTRCSDAVGYPDGRGVGDTCGASTPCAAGLECMAGMCTKSCSNEDDCKGTNANRESCPNEFNLRNLCIEGTCTSESHVDNDFCAAYGPDWAPAGAGLYCAHS